MPHPFGDIPDAQAKTWFYLGSKRYAPPVTNRALYSKDTGRRLEPREDHKGNAARAVLCTRTMYPDRVNDSFF